MIDSNTWNKLSTDDQWAITALMYKEGRGTTNLAIQAAKDANNGTIQNWEQVTQGVMAVDADCFPGAAQPSDCGVHYVNQIVGYACEMSEQSGMSCPSP